MLVACAKALGKDESGNDEALLHRIRRGCATPECRRRLDIARAAFGDAVAELREAEVAGTAGQGRVEDVSGWRC